MLDSQDDVSQSQVSQHETKGRTRTRTRTKPESSGSLPSQVTPKDQNFQQVSIEKQHTDRMLSSITKKCGNVPVDKSCEPRCSILWDVEGGSPAVVFIAQLEVAHYHGDLCTCCDQDEEYHVQEGKNIVYLPIETVQKA